MTVSLRRWRTWVGLSWRKGLPGRTAGRFVAAVGGGSLLTAGVYSTAAGGGDAHGTWLLATALAQGLGVGMLGSLGIWMGLGRPERQHLARWQQTLADLESADPQVRRLAQQQVPRQLRRLSPDQRRIAYQALHQRLAQVSQPEQVAELRTILEIALKS
ncbi:MAG: hypothetical protein IGQ88_05620 [Gloeomargaritaceae cyanobacterium C42_A2020_066]|nr:hypothetical protein [Gloeomargaritaceae cyanobacterium C42_A2020_066]